MLYLVTQEYKNKKGVTGHFVVGLPLSSKIDAKKLARAGRGRSVTGYAVTGKPVSIK